MLCCICLFAPVSEAKLVVFTDGRVLRVDDAELIDDSIQLKLIGGGIIEVPALRIDRVVNDEIDHSADDWKTDQGRCSVEYRKHRIDETVPFADLIEAAAKEANLDPLLLAALVRAESNFNPEARSRAGARGLTQLMPATAAEMGVEDPCDPAENLRAGAIYLRRMFDRFHSIELALAAYNAGARIVEEYNGIPPFRETHAYLRRILHDFCPSARPSRLP